MPEGLSFGDPEAGGIGGPELMGPGRLLVVLLSRSELILRPFHQALPSQDAVDRGLGDGGAPVICDPRRKLTAVHLR